MISLLKKEIRYFFTSTIGYVLLMVFILCNSLFLWILQGDYNILETGFSDMSVFFMLSSWLLVFLVPAITMRSISEDKKSGMLRFLLTRPISEVEIILGKYLSVLFLIFCMLATSGVFVYMLRELSVPNGGLDFGVIIGSYIAIFCLGATFSAVGVWASCISGNQIVAFCLSAFLNFVLFFGIDELVRYIWPSMDIYFGFKSHFEDISRGVIDTRNIMYFLCVIVFFLYNSVISLKCEKL